MIKLTGAFSDNAQFTAFQTWKSQADGERMELSIPQGFGNGEIIFDETTPHGTVLHTTLTSGGWTEDVSYNPNATDEQVALHESKIAQRKADAKAEQDNINETINRPNIVASLDEIPYQELTKAEYEVLPYDQLAEYHSQMVSKQNVIIDLIREKGLEDIIENWDIEGAKTKADLEAELITERAKEKVPEVVDIPDIPEV